MCCRQYRIPIKAALNGTAGAHTLKVVISPAEATANLRAAEYGYGVPGLTQPGKPSSACALRRHLPKILFNAAQNPPDVVMQGLAFRDHQPSVTGQASFLQGSAPRRCLGTCFWLSPMACGPLQDFAFAGGLSYYNFIRKPASDFGWDWGPAFTPAGIYGMIEIEAYSSAIMTGRDQQLN